MTTKNSTVSKLDKFELIYPQFKPVPQETAANVPENIDAYLDKKVQSLKDVLIPEKGERGYRGYRFISAEDLTETIRTEQWFPLEKKNVCIEFYFTRRYHAADMAFSPLWFSEWYTTIVMYARWTDKTAMYESKAQLKRFIKSLSQ